MSKPVPRISELPAMKLRFGWGPVDGPAGMQRNVELVKTVREVIGYEIDLMADAYSSSRQSHFICGFRARNELATFA